MRIINLSFHRSTMAFRSLRNPQFLPSRHRGYAVWTHRAPAGAQNQEMESAYGSAGQRTYRDAKKAQPEENRGFERRIGGFSAGVCQSIPKQVSEVNSMTEEAQMGISSLSDDWFSDFSIDDKTSDISEDIVGNKSRGLEAPRGDLFSGISEDILGNKPTMKQELEPASGGEETQDDLSSSSDEMNDLGLDDIEAGIKKASSVGKGVEDPSRERVPWFKQGLSVGDVETRKKKGKSVWICSSCGHTDGQWWGECKVCKCVGTVKRFSGGEETNGFGGARSSVRSWIVKQPDEELPMRLANVNCGIDELEWRIPLPGSFGSEVARVLGGGLVPGSLVLVGGDPGVGKSTLLLQIAALIAQGQDNCEPGPVVYVSGEESVKQIGNRAGRIKIQSNELFVYSSTDIEDILAKTHSLSPRLLIVDSIQTVYLQNVTGSAGGISQVKECTAALLRYAKQTSVSVLLTGHVTKTGDIAGPRVLEHIVDSVLYLEGEKGTGTSHRFLRCVKNRFGSTDELGVFEMTQLGLQAVENPSEMYLTSQPSDAYVLAGLAVAVVMDGTRSFLIEIQALCSSKTISSSHFNGIQAGRADMIIAVLCTQAGLNLQKKDIFVNVISGLKLSETAADLAIAVAICSSHLGLPIPCGVAFIGEIGLSGELRAVPRIDARLNTVAKLGYKKCIVPTLSVKSLKGLDHNEMEILGCADLKELITGLDHKEMQIIGCANLKEVLKTVFTNR